MRYKITLSYDGTGFCGWQTQPNRLSVQGEVQRALSCLFREDVKAVGSGRTDAGVHAIAQVAHFDANKEFEPKSVIGGLNAFLPPAIRVIDAERAADDFNARKSAKKKTYMYLCYREPQLPLMQNRALAVPRRIDVNVMRRQAESLLGKHDFCSFKAAGSSAKTSVRTIYDAHIVDDGFLIKMFLTADGFLYNMVRIIVAQLIKSGLGGDADILKLIAAKDRAQAKETAPACGLYLFSVNYEDNHVSETAKA